MVRIRLRSKVDLYLQAACEGYRRAARLFGLCDDALRVRRTNAATEARPIADRPLRSGIGQLVFFPPERNSAAPSTHDYSAVS